MDSAHIGELVLSEQQIQQGVEIVADKLNSQFSEAVIITVVPGGILFTADLVRKLKFAIKMDYISCPHTPGDSRKWVTGYLEYPFGRGINFQWDVSDIASLYARVQSKAPDVVYLPLESKSYTVGDSVATQTQFIVQSPDGYLFRFCEDVI
ncbi:hypothetical protein [Vibrio agarivorans]|uniref:hypothetical protein n=1 Tax=Vibrio agarivorans TaxID=153622 RepID=UPI0025B541EC|nr:hypothetical protein [Vibrio agarivorans]MDN3660711.1 hypothetical protein [Vibrio agarivorans]